MMTSDQRKDRLKGKAKSIGLGGMIAGGCVTLLFTIAQCAATKSVEAFNATYVRTETYNAHVAGERERRLLDSAAAIFRQKDDLRRWATNDSLLHCIRATQLHKPECE